MTAMSTAPSDTPGQVDRFLNQAVRLCASDLHVEPTAVGYEIRMRVDGQLRAVESLDVLAGRAVVNRLMVLAQLLTYRLDVPQEGKFAFGPARASVSIDLRLAVIPTVHGLRAAVRLPADLATPRSLDTLGLPEHALRGLVEFTRAEAGMLIVTGPAGSGKTTTIYALLQRIQRDQPGLSIITLEDPVERRLAGITQIEVSPFGQLTYEKALRSILRQDPQVLMLGEIRDAATASLAVQAALSGHRLVCTLHAAHPAGAIARLLEMGLEPYQITSSLFGVLTQRLLTRKAASSGASVLAGHSGLAADGLTGTPTPLSAGRVPIAEFVSLDSALRQCILRQGDVDSLKESYTLRPGYVSLRESAERLVKDGIVEGPAGLM
jgi:type II secretory ATPase GspE/PulE/Tfp pilus assembly ATPase PilB-like protein